jgi:acetyl-CoA C-acetyltransferase
VSDEAVYLVAAARTPFGSFFGALRERPAEDLAAVCIDAVVERCGVEPSAVDALYAGVGMLAAGVLTPARRAVLASGLPDTTPSMAVDRACCSGMTAIGLGLRELRGGDARLVICGGFDSLSRTPLLAERRRRTRPGDPASWDPGAAAADPLRLESPLGRRTIAEYTGEEALAHGVTREQQDDWAVTSHRRYFEAQADGAFSRELIALPELDHDESPRRSTGQDALARLPTLYGSATITAGNAPGLSDGAAFVALARASAVRELSLEPIARLHAQVSVADGPTSGCYTPALAIKRLLDRANLGLDQLALLEINEAYAATALVSTLELCGKDPAAAKALRERCNVHGGAVAIGHPLGASGARISLHLALALSAQGGGYGAAAICGGFGQGDALLLEVPAQN